LIVDEAHGTHFALHPRFPRSALACGADVVVHSPHKTLGALTQSALLHHQGDLVDPARIGRTLQMLQSSSPSAVLLLSLTVALDEMAARGHELWAAALALADRARAQIAAQGRLTVCGADLAGSAGIAGFDPTKLVVDVSGLDTTGYRAARWLKADRSINPESSDLRRLVFSITMGDTEASVDLLVEALSALAAAGIGDAAGRRIVSLWPAEPPASALTPRVAAGRPDVACPIDDAVGAVSAEMIVPYPPGVPLVVAGEVISSELVASVRQLLRHGCRMVGMSDPTGDTLRCVDPTGGRTDRLAAGAAAFA
jgi:arginine decarboxylase